MGAYRPTLSPGPTRGPQAARAAVDQRRQFRERHPPGVLAPAGVGLEIQRRLGAVAVARTWRSRRLWVTLTWPSMNQRVQESPRFILHAGVRPGPFDRSPASPRPRTTPCPAPRRRGGRHVARPCRAMKRATWDSRVRRDLRLPDKAGAHAGRRMGGKERRRRTGLHLKPRGARRGGSGRRAYRSSTQAASPSPPPMQMAATPRRAPPLAARPGA